MVEVIGRDTLMTVDIAGQKVRCLIDSDYEVKVSDVIKLTVKPQAIHLFRCSFRSSFSRVGVNNEKKRLIYRMLLKLPLNIIF